MSINRKLFVLFVLVVMMLLATATSLALAQVPEPVDEPIYAPGDVYVPGYVVVKSLDHVASLIPSLCGALRVGCGCGVTQ